MTLINLSDFQLVKYGEQRVQNKIKNKMADGHQIEEIKKKKQVKIANNNIFNVVNH